MSVFQWVSMALLGWYGLLIGLFTVGWYLLRNFRKPKEQRASGRKYTIIVPARNEEAHIVKCLEGIVNQEFPAGNLEIVVVDDHSTDNTANLVRAFMQQSPVTINLINMDGSEALGLKKGAITKAINAAANEFVVLTDADCDRGKQWIASIDAFVNEEQPVMIYAPVAFRAANFFERLQSLEFAGLVAVGGGAIRLKKPNMCSGANLIIEKQVFFEIGGYAGSKGATGDDEYLLHSVFQRYPDRVAFLKCKEAAVYTHPSPSLRQFTDQRRRWVSATPDYNDRILIAVVVAVYLFNLAVAVNLVIAPAFGLLMLGCKMLFESFILFGVLSFLNRLPYLLLVPIAEPFHIVYVLVIGIWANIRQYNWKGRRTN